MLPIQKKISSYNYGTGNEHKYIILHYTGNKGDTAKNNVDYFYGGNRNASAHFFVDDTSIWQSVEEFNYSWNCGDGGGSYGITNRNTLAIEMCCQSNGEVSATTENNTIELVKYLMYKYNIPIERVVRHYDASRKVCPNWSANNWSRWNNFKNKLANAQEDDEEVAIKDVFCEKWYLKTYQDVDKAVKSGTFKNGYDHYIQHGKAEKRKPNIGIPKDWNEAYYLYNNPDVNKNVSSGNGFSSGLHHYLIEGWKENRSWSKPNIVNEEKTENAETFYRVVTGSYKDRENAEKKKDELTNAGFESFLDLYIKSK